MATARTRKVEQAVEATTEDFAHQTHAATTEAFEKAQSHMTETTAAFEEGAKVLQAQFGKMQDIFGKVPGFGPSAELFADSRKVVHEGMVELNTEMLTFAQGTLNESFETSKAVVAAGSLQEAVSLQTAFVRKLVEHSLAESRKLYEIATETSREAMKPLSKGFEGAVEKARAA